MLTTTQFSRLIDEARRDPLPFIQACCHIITKSLPGQLPVMKLVPNTPQLRVHQVIQQARREGRPPRVIVLKARQPGISTLCEALLLTTALTRPFSQSMLIAHLDESAEQLFAKILFMLERLPEDLRPRFKTPRKDRLQLDCMPCLDGQVDLRSSILVGTASGQELWRGLTLQMAHLSEFASFPFPQELLLGLLQAIPATPETCVIIESTARGMGNVFHHEWMRAESGESGFTPVFIPWYDLPDIHTIAVPTPFILEAEEQALQAEYGLSDQALAWRRFKIAADAGGNLDYFHQEFPTTPSGAFLVTGQPCFPIRVLQEMYDVARTEEPKRGRWNSDRGFLPLRGGELAVWRAPVPDHDYILSADPSSGVISKESDPACLQVFDRITEEQVAEWHGHAPPSELAQIAMGIGKWYHTALIAPELNGGHGYAMLDVLKGDFYPRLYVYTRTDKLKGTVSNFLGWETNHRTRTLMIDTLHWALVNRTVLIRSPECIREAMEFQRIHDRPQGLDHDDRIMAFMIAYRAHIESPMLSTGLPPMIHPPEDAVPPTDLTTKKALEPGLGAAVWEEVERDLARFQRQSQRQGGQWLEYAQPDDLNDETSEQDDWMPPGGFY